MIESTWFCSVQDSVQIRTLRPNDAPLLDDLRIDYTGFRNEWIYRGTAAEFIDKSVVSELQGRGFWAGIWVSGRMAGVIGYHPLEQSETEKASDRSASIDYMLAPEFRGRGVMTRCVRALTRNAFRAWGATWLEVRCDAANEAGCRVAERAGFVRAVLSPGAIDYGDDHGVLAVYVADVENWVDALYPGCGLTVADGVTGLHR